MVVPDALEVEVSLDGLAELGRHGVVRVEHEGGHVVQPDGRLVVTVRLELEDCHGGVISDEEFETLVEPGDRMSRHRSDKWHCSEICADS